jgi:hypothetical protein
MAMFPRRALQRLLDQLKDILPLEARIKLAHELDRPNASALGYEWELALLFALSRVGQVTYEATQSGTRRPDLAFVATEGPIRFVADVATISDAGLEAENPMMRFSQSVHRLKRKYHLSGGISYDVKGEMRGASHRDRKMRLKLPKASDLDRFLAEHVGPEFQRISEEKRPKATIAVNVPGVEFTLTYAEGQQYGGGHYPSYTAAQSPRRNPVYTALKSKIDQLKKSKATDPLGIFLCDGGCSLLAKAGPQPQQVSLDHVIGEFFRQNSSIAFVVILVFPQMYVEAFTGLVKEVKITGRVYSNPRAANPVPGKTLIELLNRGLAALPQPVARPHDALHWIARSDAHEGQTIETFTQGGTMFKMSARKLQEILSGKITVQEYFAGYDTPGKKMENPFRRALERGLTMDAINLAKNPDIDDDLIEIRFGPPDPAISRFKVD